MSEHLTLIDPDSNTGPTPAWSLIPPRAVRRRLYRTIRTIRRPAGTLALPAVATTGTLYFTHVLPHGDAPFALGLTALVVLYDSVVTVCRTWQRTSTAAAPGENRTTDSARAV
ncbi:hypothetical protein ACFYXC_29395 [Streptomyces sp. NPDC002701]|uniref:hypothetical protein n=1 Tax=unclassified Streptomyces TaxID=2593676 RepID=UPI0036C39CFE